MAVQKAGSLTLRYDVTNLIDPLSENFAYLSPVIYCPSCAQLVFNTLPGAPALLIAQHCAARLPRGQYFTARPCQDRGLPETVGSGVPTCVRRPAAGPRRALTVGQGEDGWGPA